MQTIYEKEHATEHFYKVWFTDGKRRTAQVIVSTKTHPLRKTSVQEYSRLFPYSESPKMKKLIIGNRYATWEQAFKSERGNP